MTLNSPFCFCYRARARKPTKETEEAARTVRRNEEKTCLYMEQVNVTERSNVMDEERDLVNEAINLSFQGLEDNAFGTKEREAAAKEFADFERIHNERFKAYDNASLEREKLEAEKEKANRESRIEEEKIKSEERKDKRNVFVKVISLIGVVVISVFSLVADSENFMGRGSKKLSNFVIKLFRL